MKMARFASGRHIPLRDKQGEMFRICQPGVLRRQLSQIDRSLSGRATVSDQLTNPGTRDRYLVSALIEEAITSSQLEGAVDQRTLNNLVKIEKSPVYIPGKLVEIESNYYDHFGAIRYPMVTWTLRRVSSDAVRVEIRTRGRLTEDPDGQERSFGLISKCAGPRRPELE